MAAYAKIRRAPAPSRKPDAAFLNQFFVRSLSSAPTVLNLLGRFKKLTLLEHLLSPLPQRVPQRATIIVDIELIVPVLGVAAVVLKRDKSPDQPAAAVGVAIDCF